MTSHKLLFGNLFPEEIQDLIGEYNVGHRPIMKSVLQEIEKTKFFCKECYYKYKRGSMQQQPVSIQYVNCYGDDNYYEYRKYSRYDSYTYNSLYLVCSDICKERVLRRKEIIDSYEYYH